ncbi:hypothetical protein UFOVP1082_28 [uncultured Caudovirales phage]|uniref:Uncharacterized protein n=1 Tax=uncultured Caudovirales phage TaxID=2100421 RepID=A0A6J5QA07_9CAUD|nr:hypothetical protein UFOVP906_6 [uncultured Caudovirales phage]CAB4176454.1 hypothetical protein UFOVP992_32 [uncultured Caudovirales phage]CAB4183299.1 hypothetical protein UFOVP1082_28 [uncultured Caudovirales phage]CAB4197282.1 hypothetical protein UFOVP1322_13 [uncultured Caudovirales phage]CAB4212674.1 hypothetical protein UFOVP1434_35 [uncultured Caudovirales phage]
MNYFIVKYRDEDTKEEHEYKPMTMTSAIQILRVLAQDGYKVSIQLIITKGIIT